MQTLSERISRYMVRVGAAKEDNREVIAYGLFHILADMEQLLILATLSLPFGLLPQMGCFVLFYGSLRRYIGGAHASKHWLCLVVYTSAALLCTILGTWCPAYLAAPVAAVCAVLSFILVFLRAPVMHPNNPRPAHVTLRFKKKGRIAVTVQLAVILAGLFLAPEWARMYLLCATLGSMAASLTLLFPVQKRKEGNI